MAIPSSRLLLYGEADSPPAKAGKSVVDVVDHGLLLGAFPKQLIVLALLV